MHIYKGSKKKFVDGKWERLICQKDQADGGCSRIIINDELLLAGLGGVEIMDVSPEGVATPSAKQVSMAEITKRPMTSNAFRVKASDQDLGRVTTIITPKSTDGSAAFHIYYTLEDQWAYMVSGGKKGGK